MAEQLGEAVLTVRADTRQLQAGLDRARQQAEALRGALAQLGVGLSFAGTLAFIGQQIKELDSASAAVRTLGVNSDELGQRLRALSVELGSSVSQIELTKAAYDVASSGFATAADATQVLKAAALGAQGGFAQLDDVVRAVTGVLNAYGLSADQATKIVDQFLQTQNDGVITVRQYAAEIGNIASIAAAGGVGLDQLNAAIATATLRGVPVAQTFTGLRQALSSIIKPSQQAAELAASLGLQFNVSALKSKGLAGVLADLQQKTGGSAEKIAVLLGSVEAQAAVQPLLNDKLAKYNELLDKNAKANGTAAEAAKINSSTISGGLAQIGNGFSNLATTLDKTLTPLFAGFISGLNDILTKLNQVAALSPEAVKKREQEASRIVETAKQNSPNFNTRVFFGTPLVSPNTEIVYDGQTFKGTITGVRNELVKYLLTKELKLGTGPEALKGLPLPRRPVVGGAPPAGAVVSPAELDYIRQANALEQKGLQDKLALASQLNKLDELTALKRQNELNLNEKIRSVELARLQLQREQAKPIGSTGSPAEQDPKKLLDLQNKIQAGQVEIATQRIQNQQAEDQAFRKRREQQQTLALELKAFQQGPDAVVSPTALLRIKLANMDVREAYAQAGKLLVDNARNAASALKSAQQGFDSAARGGFQFLTPFLQQEQLRKARDSVQAGVDRGLIRTGIDISSPEKLFQVAAFAEQIVPAQKQLENALAENTKATVELTKKDWNVYLGGKPITAPAVPTVSSEPVTFVRRDPAASAYGTFGGY